MSDYYANLGLKLLGALEPSLTIALDGSGAHLLAATPAPAAPPPPRVPAAPTPPTVRPSDAGEIDMVAERAALADLSTKLEIVSIQARIAQLTSR